MKRIFYFVAVSILLIITACGGDDEPADPCATVINVSTETTRSDPDGATGSVTILASGGNGGFTYSLNQGTAQQSNVFTNLAAGSYTVVVQDQENCSQTVTFQIDEVLTASFATDIMPIIQGNCATSGCHITGGVAPITFRNYAEISAQGARIKIRTGARTMPPAGNGGLSQLQIDLIAAWVDAGAQNN